MIILRSSDKLAWILKVNFIEVGLKYYVFVTEVAMPSICLLDEKKVNVYTVDGEDFLSPLQFKVSCFYSIGNLLLYENI